MDEQIVYTFENQWASVLFLHFVLSLIRYILVDSIGFLFILFLLFFLSDSNCSVDDQKFVSFKEEAFFFGDEEFTLRFFLFCFVFICNQH